MSITELYLSTSLTVAFRRGMRATSSASATLRPSSTVDTSSLRESWISGWRASSYRAQDIVLEIWWDNQQNCFNLVWDSEPIQIRKDKKKGWSYCVNSSQKQLCDVAVDSLHGQPCLGEEVGEITALHFLPSGDLVGFSRQALIDVIFCCKWKTSKADKARRLQIYLRFDAKSDKVFLSMHVTFSWSCIAWGFKTLICQFLI